MAPRNRPLIRRSILILTLAGLSLVALSLAFVDVVPRRAITPSAMTETSVRIEMYYQRNKRLPADLDVLPVRESYANRTTDAWNRPLRYTIDSDDAFTLSSFGEDGVPGGTGDNADVTRKYRVEHGEVRPVSQTNTALDRPGRTGLVISELAARITPFGPRPRRPGHRRPGGQRHVNADLALFQSVAG